MGSIGGKVAHKWFILFRRFHHEAFCLIKEDVGAIALKLFFLPVVHVDIVKIIVSPIGRNRRDGGGWIPHTFLKTAVLWTVGIVCPQVPLSENPSRITRVSKIVCHNGDFRPNQGPATTHIDRSVSGGIQPSQKLPTRGRTHGGDMIIGQAQALSM